MTDINADAAALDAVAELLRGEWREEQSGAFTDAERAIEAIAEIVARVRDITVTAPDRPMTTEQGRIDNMVGAIIDTAERQWEVTELTNALTGDPDGFPDDWTPTKAVMNDLGLSQDENGEWSGDLELLRALELALELCPIHHCDDQICLDDFDTEHCPYAAELLAERAARLAQQPPTEGKLSDSQLIDKRAQQEPPR